MKNNNDGCRSVERVTLTRVVALRGRGTQGDPYREHVSYWFDDGTRLVDVDGFELSRLEATLCEPCRQKPGAPELCSSCLANRKALAFARSLIGDER